MCLATPRRVLRVEGDHAEVEWDGEPLRVATGGFDTLAPGDYVLIHAGLVVDRISAEEADQILELYATMEGADLSLIVTEETEGAHP
jgi:hydrogenase expression/formation protein HypC